MATRGETLSLPKAHIPEKLTISNSLTKDWRACRRKFYFHYIALLDTKKLSIPFFVGSHFHKGMEAFYAGEDPDEFVPRIVKSMRDKASKAVFLTPEDEQKLMIQEAIVAGMLRGYAAHYKKDLKKWKVFAAEKEFSVPIIEGRIEYVGQIDLVVEYDGRLWLVEHKTAGRLDRNYVERLALDTQITGYSIGAKHVFKENIAGIIYNVAKKPQIRQRKDETPDEFAQRIEEDYLARPEFYFYREELLRDKSTIGEYKAEIAEVAADIEDVVAATQKDPVKAMPRYYRNTDHCTARGQCPYMAICTKGWNEDTQRLYNVREKLNPELGNVESDEDGGGD